MLFYHRRRCRQWLIARAYEMYNWLMIHRRPKSNTIPTSIRRGPLHNSRTSPTYEWNYISLGINNYIQIEHFGRQFAFWAWTVHENTIKFYHQWFPTSQWSSKAVESPKDVLFMNTIHQSPQFHHTNLRLKIIISIHISVSLTNWVNCEGAKGIARVVCINDDDDSLISSHRGELW